MQRNEIGSEGVCKIAIALTSNTSLENLLLSVSFSNLTEIILNLQMCLCKAIAKALTINSTLSSLQLAVSFTSLACTVPNQYLLG